MKLLNSTFVCILVLFFSIMEASAQKVMELSDRWEFVKGDLGSVWEAVRYAPNGLP